MRIVPLASRLFEVPPRGTVVESHNADRQEWLSLSSSFLRCKDRSTIGSRNSYNYSEE